MTATATVVEDGLTVSVTTKLTWPKGVLLDLLINGIEGGMTSQWAQFDRYRWSKWYEKEVDGKEPDMDTPRADLGLDEDLIQVRDMFPDDDTSKPGEWVVITLRKLAIAASRTVQEYPWTIMPIETGYDRKAKQTVVTSTNDDAITGDIIIQFICMDEVRYG